MQRDLFEYLLKQANEKHSYPDATRGAPPEVVEFIKRFRKFPEAERSKYPLLYRILGRGTPAFKMTKEDTEYTDKSTIPGKTCGNCEYAYTATFTQGTPNERVICSWVQGDIKKPGWCNRWIKGNRIYKRANQARTGTTSWRW